MHSKYPETIVFMRRPNALNALGTRPGDWEYLTNVAGRVRGDSWIRLLLGGDGHATSTRGPAHNQRSG